MCRSGVRRRRLEAIVGLGLLLGLCASATSLRAVSGKVTDQNGKPLSGAVVKIENRTSLQVRSFITQADGAYHFSQLSRDADYDLKPSYHGIEGTVKSLSQFDSADSKVIDLEVRVPK